MSSPKKITHVVHPEGSTTHTGKDNGMTVQFEKGCVNQELTLEYTVGIYRKQIYENMILLSRDNKCIACAKVFENN